MNSIHELGIVSPTKYGQPRRRNTSSLITVIRDVRSRQRAIGTQRRHINTRIPTNGCPVRNRGVHLARGRGRRRRRPTDPAITTPTSTRDQERSSGEDSNQAHLAPPRKTIRERVHAPGPGARNHGGGDHAGVVCDGAGGPADAAASHGASVGRPGLRSRAAAIPIKHVMLMLSVPGRVSTCPVGLQQPQRVSTRRSVRQVSCRPTHAHTPATHQRCRQ